MIRFEIVTIFPEIIKAYSEESIIKRAQQKGIVQVNVHDLRNWATDKHRTVDDKIYGGGPGMLLKIEPMYRAISAIKESLPENFKTHCKVVLTSPSGELFTQNVATAIATERKDQCFIILCGHYEGIDYRIHEFVDFSFSIGPIILTGGELPSLMFIDAITRLLPGALGNELSSQNDTTFTVTNNMINIVGEYPQYTRPDSFTFTDLNGNNKTLPVPEILLSGNHKEINLENEKNRIEKEVPIIE